MEKSAGRLIWAVHRKRFQYVASKLKDCDIEVGQFFFLRYLLKNQGISQEEVAHKLYLDKTTVSKGVKQLVQLGYIKKQCNPKDKREHHLFVTKKAVEAEEMIDSIFEEIDQYLFEQLSNEELEQLKKLLEKLI